MKIYVLRLFILSTKLTIYGVALQCLFLSTMLAEPGIAQKVESVREVIVDLNINKTRHQRQILHSICIGSSHRFNHTIAETDDDIMLPVFTIK